MAITWGPVQTASGTKVQLGLDFSTATYATYQRVTAIVYLRCTAGWVSDNYNTLVVYGSMSHSVTNVPASLSAGQQTELGRVSKDVNRKYGSVVPVSVSARLDAFTVGTPTASKTHNVPAIAYTAPARPSYTKNVREADNRIVMEWSVSSTTAAPISRIVIQRATNGGSYSTVATLGASIRAWTDTTGTGANTWASYRIRAEGAGGVSSWNTWTPVYMTPAAPRGVQASRSGGDIKLEWANVAVAPAEIEVWDGSGRVTTVPTGTTSYTLSGYSAVQPHTFRVRAVIDGVVSEFAYSNSVQLASAPNPPANLSPDGEWFEAGNVVTVLWDHVPTDSSAQTQYTVQYRRNGASAWSTLSGTTAQSRHLTSLASTTVIEWRVRTTGQDTSKWSEYSNSAFLYFQKKPTVSWVNPPSTVGASTQQFTFTDAISGLHQYEWELVSGGQVLSRSSGSKASGSLMVTARSLANGTSYTIRVRVLDRIWSDWVSHTFSVAYPAPALPSVVPTWDRDAGVVSLLVGVPTSSVPAQSVSVERFHPESSTWLLLADGLSPSTTTITDQTAHGNGVNTYRVTSYSALGIPSVHELTVDTSVSPIWSIHLTSADRSATVQVRWNPARSMTTGLADMELHQMAGRVRPVMFAGVHIENRVSISGVIMRSEWSDVERAQELVMKGQPVLYRDPDGVHMWGAISSVSFDREERLGSNVISLVLEEVDFVG